MGRVTCTATAGRPHGLVLGTALGCLMCLPVLASALAQGRGAADARQCWPPEALRSKAADAQIRRAIPAAFISAPKGEPAIDRGASAIRPGAIRRVDLPPGSKKLIALTFDLCEQPNEVAGYQGAIVDLLRAQDVKATFFAGGKWLLTHRERAQQLMSDPLFEIGNHTWEHRNLRIVSPTVLASELNGPQLAYERVRGELEANQCRRPGDRILAHERAPSRMTLFRFPFGACDANSLAAVAAAGLSAIQWDVSSGDPWPLQTANNMTRGVLANVRPGSIVLFHANGRGWKTESALPVIIEKLKAEGYQFVTVSELLRAGEPVVADTCYDAKLGDSNRYDAFARRMEIIHQRAAARFGPRASKDPAGAERDAGAGPGGWVTRRTP